ncbi:MAG TPA: GNAT family N-acetyltransferase [Pyrinomonadaceae bacterium]|jgi:GNAT superfamily N-acetyltransferase
MSELQGEIRDELKMSFHEWQNGEFTISTDRARLQTDAIQKFLTEESYWAKTRTPEQTATAIKNSLPFGVYKGENQIGFARVVTDYATFAYLGDVYILAEYRGRGLSKWLMDVIINHPDLQNFRRWILATRDAHALYEKFGFTALKAPGRWMEKAAPNAY